MRRLKRAQRGQSTMEYIVVGALLTALVAVPIGGQRSALQLMLWAIREAWAKFLAALSLPMPL
jgi:hypothetical protein